MMFTLYGNPKIGLLLKSYKAQTVNGKSTVTIICETTDHMALSWSLRELDEVASEQKKVAAAAKTAARAAKTAARAAKKPKHEAPLLALPAPQLALPKPGGAA